MGRRLDVTYISCKGLVSNRTLMEQMRRMLRCIQDEYGYPVDTEFTVNISVKNGAVKSPGKRRPQSRKRRMAPVLRRNAHIFLVRQHLMS